MTVEKLKQAETLQKKIKDAEQALNALINEQGRPRFEAGGEKNDDRGELLFKFFREYKNISSDNYKKFLEIVAFEAVVKAIKEDIKTYKFQFDEL